MRVSSFAELDFMQLENCAILFFEMYHNLPDKYTDYEKWDHLWGIALDSDHDSEFLITFIMIIVRSYEISQDNDEIKKWMIDNLGNNPIPRINLLENSIRNICLFSKEEAVSERVNKSSEIKSTKQIKIIVTIIIIAFIAYRVFSHKGFV